LEQETKFLEHLSYDELQDKKFTEELEVIEDNPAPKEIFW